VIQTTNLTKSNDPGQCGAAFAHGTTATDNCGTPSLVGVRDDGHSLSDPYPVGVTTITWTATDIHSNSSSATQTITVNDTEKPVLSAHADIAQTNDAGQCGRR